MLSGLFFFRFHILTALFLAVFPILAQQGRTVALLGGLIVLEDWFAIAVVTYLAFLVSWVVMVTTVLTWTYGGCQFGVTLPPAPAWLLRYRLPLFSLLAAPTLVAVGRLSPSPWPVKLASMAAGAAAALLTVAIASGLRRFFTDPATRVENLFFGTGGALGERLHALDTLGMARHTWARQAVRWLVTRMFAWLGPGYVDPEGRLRSGHAAALVFFGVVFACYVAGYHLFFPSEHATLRPPALAYVLFLVLLLTWALTAVAFVVDRFRVSVVLLGVGVTMFVYFVTDTDHYFAIDATATATAPLTAAQVLGPRSADEDLVVVSAAGGGIRSAMWTARVLTGLQEELGPEFSRAIRVISAVSGGGVGAMYFVDAFTAEHGPPAMDRLSGIVAAAARSSLSEVAWGIVYPDLMRLVWPLPVGSKDVDRAWALEQVWRRHLRNPETTIAGWQQGVCEGWRPAVVFNATMAETGARLLIAPIDIPAAGGADLFRTQFFRHYPQADIAVVRAARLAATFPYVTPLARARWSATPGQRDAGSPPGDHVGDGGYYDNFGVATLVDWLEALRAAGLRPRRLLIVEIRATPRELGTPPVAARRNAGWIYDTLGPAVAMLNVRAATQAARNQVELAQLMAVWKAERHDITRVQFAPVEKDGPLSWHLTTAEQAAVHSAWQYARTSEDMRKVREWWSHKGARVTARRECQPMGRSA